MTITQLPTPKPSRPEWSTVMLSALSLELHAAAYEMREEASLWHNEPGFAAIVRAAVQLDFVAAMVPEAQGYVAMGDAWLKAARRTLPLIQATRERRTLGVAQ